MPHKDPDKAKAYHKEYMRAYLLDPEKRANRNAVANARIRKVKDWINAYKLASGCVDCGYDKHPAALDFDHMDGKTANVSQLKSIASVQAEIARHKCVVRCANCHRVKSFETKTWVRLEAAE